MLGRVAASMRLWLAVAALLVPLLAPYQAALADAPRAGAFAILCTANGPVVIDLSNSSDDAPADGASATMHCPLCGFGSVQNLWVPTSGPILNAPTANRRVVFSAIVSVGADIRSIQDYYSRAPPVN